MATDNLSDLDAVYIKCCRNFINTAFFSYIFLCVICQTVDPYYEAVISFKV